MSDSRLDLLNGRIVGVNLPIKKMRNNLALSTGEDVGSHKVTTVGKALNTLGSYSRNRRIRASEREAKNSVGVAWMEPKSEAVTERGTAKLDKATIRGKLVEFAWWMKKNGYADTTIRVWMSVLNTLTKLGANLLDPESVKDTIAKAVCLKINVGKPWSNARKYIAISAYTLFLRMLGKKWDPPRCKVTRKIPFIPMEQELDALIAGCGRKTASFLQLLKETGMRAGEATTLSWTDIDFQHRNVTLNKPEKYGNPRMFSVSSKLTDMLAALPKKNEKVFANTTMSSLKSSYYKSRKILARKLQNPRLVRITFHTFRHWKATTLYHQTKDPLYVKEFLGHKKLDTTLLYIQIEQAIYKGQSDEFTVKVAKTQEEIKSLLEVGFEYVCEKEGLMFFRKRK